MLLEKVKELLGVDEVPEDVSEYYTKAEDLREALYLVREARYRDEQRKGRAMEDLKILEDKERELMDRGRAEENETRRKILASKVKEIRDKKDEIRHKINEIYNKRIQIYAEHMKSLETLVEMEEEPVPTSDALQEYAVKAREKLEKLDETYAMAEGVEFSSSENVDVTDEEREILDEFEEDRKEETKTNAEEDREEEELEEEKEEESSTEVTDEEEPEEEPFAEEFEEELERRESSDREEEGPEKEEMLE